MKRLLKLFLCVLALCLCTLVVAQAEETGTECTEHSISCITGACRACGQTDVQGYTSHSYGDEAQSDETYHWWICTDCNQEVDKFEHYLSCATGVCRSCGATDVQGHTGHSYLWDEAQSDETYHWWICNDCNQEVNKAEHWRACTDPSSCGTCGAAYTAGELGHSFYDWDVWESDETQHWHVCVDCNEIIDPVNHRISCATGACITCCETGVTGETSHDWDLDNWSHDDTQHWVACKNCDMITNEGPHELSCTTGACRACGQTDVQGYTGHSFVWDEAQSDETYHWWICSDCNQEANKSEHYISCATGVCHSCGATDVQGNTGHSIEGEAQSDETYHWWICTDCNQEVDKFEHWRHCTDPSSCASCGIAYTAGELGHSFYEWTPWESDETQHWRVCIECNEAVNLANHQISCATNACTICGATGLSGNVVHEWDWDNYSYDETHHWRACKSCDEKLNYAPHGLSCTTGACTQCGETGVTGETSHDWDWDNYGYDDTIHWLPCKNCDAVTNRGTHYTMCYDSPNTCSSCGQSDVTIVGGASHAVENWEVWEFDSTQHWHICVHCNNPCDVGDHQIDCATGACSQCGETGVTGETSHDWDWDNYGYDDTIHWLPCKNCDAVTNNFGHEIDCISGTCTFCGATDVTGHISHDTSENGAQYNDTMHWWICSSCNEQVYQENHWINCTTGACDGCGAQNVSGYENHHYDWTSPQFDETHHWWICELCNEVVNRGTHYLNCTTGACFSCGQSDVTGESGHEPDWNNPQSNATEHWYACVLCGEEAMRSTHYIDCQTGACNVCGLTNVEGDASHTVDWLSPLYDNNHHWFICTLCGEEANKSQHWYDCLTHACSTCGIVNEAAEVTHGVEVWGVYSYNETQHFQMCVNCGSAFDFSDHYIPCNGDACNTCGATGVQGHTGHTVDWENAEYNETEHWAYCVTCGELGVQDTHFELCMESDGACNACGITGVTLEILHSNSVSLMFDETQHWYECYWCAEKVEAEAHDVDADGTCTACGATGLESTECAHDYQYSVVKAATCTAAGLGETVCTLCGDVQSSEEIPALGHSTTIHTTAATCTKSGVKKSVCSRCNTVVSSESIPALGHDAVTTTTEPTCTADGLVESVCSRCNAVVSSEVLPALGHAYETVTALEATCTEAGMLETVCSRCGDVESTEEVAALGHDRWFTVTAAATCTADGVRTYYCYRCEATLDSQAIPATGHALSTSDQGDHLLETCSNCDYENVIAKEIEEPAEEPIEKPVEVPSEEPAEEPAEEPVKIEVAPAVLPEEVVVTPVEDAKVEGAPETIQIIVQEVALEDTPVLPLPAEVEPAKVLTVSVVMPEGETEVVEVAAPEQVKIVLPMEEEEIAALEGLKLVLILSDGTMVEIPYEVVDGQLVFVAPAMGVFAFIAAE